MIAHEHARRGEILYARLPGERPARKRLAGKRTETTDDLGREIMPFDLFLDQPADLVELMADVFGERAA